MKARKRNVLFNDALNTYYLRLYGVRHMVKDHSDSEKGNPLMPHRLLLSINSKGSFICTIPDRIAHTAAFVTPVVEHWMEREIAYGGRSPLWFYAGNGVRECVYVRAVVIALWAPGKEVIQLAWAPMLVGPPGQAHLAHAL